MDASEYPYAAQQPERREDHVGPAAACSRVPKHPALADHRLTTALGWLVLLLPALLMANIAMMPIGETVGPGGRTEMLLLAIIGVVAAEAALVPTAMVFGLGSIVVRAMGCLLAAYGLCAVWLAGLFIMAWQHSYPQPIQAHWFQTIEQVAWGMTLWIPAALLAYQAPLWLLKVYFGWKLVRSDTGLEPAARPPTIADYLRTMVVIGVALALARWHVADQDGEQVVILLLIFGAGGAVACLLGVVPTMLLLLRLRHGRWGLAGLATYCVLLSMVLLAVQIAATGHAGWVGWYEWALVAVPLLTWGGTLAACAGIVRVAGYRLQIGRPKPAIAEVLLENRP